MIRTPQVFAGLGLGLLLGCGASELDDTSHDTEPAASTTAADRDLGGTQDMGVGDAVADYDGNVYDTVVIGSQTWLQQDLRALHYMNGDPIEHVTDHQQWQQRTTGAYAYYDNDPTHGEVFGVLYNGYAAEDERGLCPQGFHIPSNDEWAVLFSELGGPAIAGAAMKETGITHWADPNVGATNASGFSGRGGGSRVVIPGGTSITFTWLYTNSSYWSADEMSSTRKYCQWLHSKTRDVFQADWNKWSGFSIRCVGDA